MRIIDHGEWERYTPLEPNPDAPPNTMYARRKKDGMDWYQFVHPGDHTNPGTVKLVCAKEEGEWVVAVAVRDATMLFPANRLLLEIYDWKGDPAVLERQIYYPTTKEFKVKVKSDDANG